jgi:hypothetical protein
LAVGWREPRDGHDALDGRPGLDRGGGRARWGRSDRPGCRARCDRRPSRSAGGILRRLTPRAASSFSSTARHVQRSPG